MNRRDFHLTTTSLDYKIPVIEIFIVPYYLWFLFIAAFWLYFFIKNDEDYWNYFKMLAIGMTAFIVISAIYPTALDLRPDTLARDNIFTQMLQYMWSVDTPTNVLPSIHVYNSLATAVAVHRSQSFKNKRGIQIAVLAMALLICVSTLFTRQHSILDLVAGVVLIFAVIPFAYSHQDEQMGTLVKEG
jgi:membrane-associated phospholipid phosphatase